MAGYNAGFVFGQSGDGLPSLNHITHIIDERKRVFPPHVVIEMRGIGSEDDRSSCSLDPYDLKAIGMPAHPMQIDSRRHGSMSTMEDRAAGIDMTHHFDHRFDVAWLTKDRVTHRAARRICH